MLGNLLRGLIPFQKHLLYRLCILPIALYGSLLWFYNKVPLSYSLKVLRDMQHSAALWILGVFRILPSLDIEAIAGLIPIQLHLQKLSGKIQLCTHSLLPNHIINSILEVRYFSNKEHHLLLMENLTTKQKLKIKEPIVDANNRLNGIFKLFDLFNLEFFPGNRLVDLFFNCISFSYSDRRSIDFRKSHIRKLDEVVFNASTDPNSAIIVSDVSIKNNIVTSIAHIHTHNSPIIKTIHHTTNVISTEAKLFVIRCGMN